MFRGSNIYSQGIWKTRESNIIIIISLKSSHNMSLLRCKGVWFISFVEVSVWLDVLGIINRNHPHLRYAAIWNLEIHTRWAPNSYKWSYNPYKWPCNWVTGVITILITGRGPILHDMRWVFWKLRWIHKSLEKVTCCVFPFLWNSTFFLLLS